MITIRKIDEPEGVGKSERGTIGSAPGYYAAFQETMADVKQLIREAQISPNGNTRSGQLQHECERGYTSVGCVCLCSAEA